MQTLGAPASLRWPANGRRPAALPCVHLTTMFTIRSENRADREPARLQTVRAGLPTGTFDTLAVTVLALRGP